MNCEVDAKASLPDVAFDEKAFLAFCGSRASDCNQQARARGEECRVSASELFDLYVRQHGRCAITGLRIAYEKGKTSGPLVPQLDHIVEVRRSFRGRASFLLSDGNEDHASGSEGKAADIENLQWVCKFANSLKERFRQAGLPMQEICQAIVEQFAAGFPIRSACHDLGLRGAQRFRRQFIEQELRNSPGISAMQMHERLIGSVGEACYQVVLKTMQELGWQASEVHGWREKRLEVIRAIAVNGVIVCDSFREFVVKANEMSGHYRGFSGTCWRQDAASIGVVFARTIRRSISSISNGDVAACVAHLKTKGDFGQAIDDFQVWCASRDIPKTLVENLLDRVRDIGAVYEHHGKLYASLTRAEAAKLIGVSPNRLKKWGRSDWGDLLAGPPFVKKTKKGKTYYKRHEVAEFIAQRGSHGLDLSVYGQRPECVTGGAIGGQRAAIGHGLRRAGSLVAGSTSGGG